MSYWKVAAVLLLGLGCGIAVMVLLGKATGALSGLAKPKTLYMTVVNDETKEFIPHADVVYTIQNSFAAVPPIHLQTDEKGTTSGIAIVANASFTLEVEAKGYYHLSGSFQKNRNDLENVTCRLRKLPKIALIVPHGYTGPVTFALAKSRNSTNNAKSQKQYELHVNAKGEIADADSIQSAEDYFGLSKTFEEGVVVARYEDGREISPTDAAGVTDSTIALRPFKLAAHPTPGIDFNRTTVATGRQVDKWTIFVIGTAQNLKEATDKKSNAEEQEVKVQLHATPPAP